MRTPRGSRAAVVAAALVAASLPGLARASESDAFEGKIQPVSGQLYPKAGRFEITPTFVLSVHDSFYTKYLGGLKLGYHFSEYPTGGWLFLPSSVHVSFATGTTSLTGSTPLALPQLPGRIKTMVGAEAAWSLVYGKLNLLAEYPLHFDFSFPLLGLDYLSFENSLDSSAIGAHVGVGVRFFFAGFMALRVELKDYLYSAQVVDSTQHKQLQQQLMAEMGLSFFFPTSPKSSRP